MHGLPNLKKIAFDVVIIDCDKCSSTIQRKFSDFSWQQCLGDSVTVLRHAHNCYVAFPKD
jgi:hypothetical protein